MPGKTLLFFFVLCPGPVGNADSGGSFQRFRGAAGCLAGGGKTRGNLHIHLSEPTASVLTRSSSRRLEAQCDALMLSTVSWFSWVFLGLMSVLCSCKAWIHSSGARQTLLRLKPLQEREEGWTEEEKNCRDTRVDSRVLQVVGMTVTQGLCFSYWPLQLQIHKQTPSGGQQTLRRIWFLRSCWLISKVLSLNNSLCLTLPLSQYPLFPSPLLHFSSRPFSSLSPLRVADILRVIPSEKKMFPFAALPCAVQLSGVIQGFDDARESSVGEITTIWAHLQKKSTIQSELVLEFDNFEI